MEISDTRERMILGLLMSGILPLVRAFYNKSIKWDWLESVKLSSISFFQMLSWSWTVKINLPFNTVIIPPSPKHFFFLCCLAYFFFSLPHYVVHSYAKIHIPIIASVSEHQPTTWVSFFFDLHILVCTFPAGLWFCIKNINDERVFGKSRVVQQEFLSLLATVLKLITIIMKVLWIWKKCSQQPRLWFHTWRQSSLLKWRCFSLTHCYSFIRFTGLYQGDWHPYYGHSAACWSGIWLCNWCPCRLNRHVLMREFQAGTQKFIGLYQAWQA